MLGITRESVQWLFAELVVVVLGILIAFQIDEWRSELGNRDRVVTALTAILSDLDVGEREFDLWHQQIAAAHESTRAFIQLLRRQEPVNEAAITPYLQRSIYGTRFWAPTATAFSGARDNGDFAAIRDDELQTALVYYFDVLEPYLLETRQSAQRHREVFIAELMQTSMLVPDADFVTSGKTSARLARDASAMQSDLALNNSLVRYHQGLDSQLRRIEFGKTQLTKLRERIRKHLVDLGRDPDQG